MKALYLTEPGKTEIREIDRPVPWQVLFPSEHLSLRELALIEPLTVGFHAVNRARICAGEKVAVIGCGIVGMGAAAACVSRQAEVIAVDIDDSYLQYGLLWVQPVAMILGVIMLAAISHQTLSTGDDRVKHLTANNIIGHLLLSLSFRICLVISMFVTDVPCRLHSYGLSAPEAKHLPWKLSWQTRRT